MSVNDRMARLRQRAEIEPSSDEDGQSSQESSTSGCGSDDDGSLGKTGDGEHGQDGEYDDWDEQEVDGKGPNTALSGSSPVNREQEEQSIGKRLESLTHGAGPSRRKRHMKNIKGSASSGGQQPADILLKALQNTKSSRVTDNMHESREPENSRLSRPKTHSRANKNRPQEVSSLRAVGRFREVVAGKRNTSRDPRFEGGGESSKLNYDIFRKAYGFLETYQDKEIQELRESLKKEKNQERSGRLQALLTRLQQERAERSQGDRRQTAIRGAKKNEREAVAGGKKPYYLKGSEKRRLSQEQRYEGLKEEGKLGKFMEKKRKKNAAKDHRWLPAKRQDRG